MKEFKKGLRIFDSADEAWGRVYELADLPGEAEEREMEQVMKEYDERGEGLAVEAYRVFDDSDLVKDSPENN